MTKIGRSGTVEVERENEASSADVYILTSNSGASLTQIEAWDLIVAIAIRAGIRTEPTETGNGRLTLIRPETAAIQERREELSHQFFVKPFESLAEGTQGIINFIIEGEIKREELR